MQMSMQSSQDMLTCRIGVRVVLPRSPSAIRLVGGRARRRASGGGTALGVDEALDALPKVRVAGPVAAAVGGVHALLQSRKSAGCAAKV